MYQFYSGAEIIKELIEQAADDNKSIVLIHNGKLPAYIDYLNELRYRGTLNALEACENIRAGKATFMGKPLRVY